MGESAHLLAARWSGIPMWPARVIKAHRPLTRAVVRFAAGDSLTTTQVDADRPGWLWTTAADGSAGWAPEEWLRPLHDGRAEALRDYASQELDATPGLHGYICRARTGWCLLIAGERSGWIPTECLDVDAQDDTPEPAVETLAEAWVAYYTHGGHDDQEATEPYLWACLDVAGMDIDDPERLWAVILAIWRLPEATADPHIQGIVAVKVEDLLALHGPAFRKRAEAQARRDPTFPAVSARRMDELKIRGDALRRELALLEPHDRDGAMTATPPDPS